MNSLRRIHYLASGIRVYTDQIDSDEAMHRHQYDPVHHQPIENSPKCKQLAWSMTLIKLT